MANYLAPEDDPVNYLPARVNPNLAAQGRRYNLAERQQTSPLMQAGNVQFAKELSSMGNRGSVTDLINRGLIANTAGLPVDMLNTVLQTLGLGSEQPLGGSDSIRRALEYYGLSSETQRPMLETLASLTPPRAVMGAARVAGQGAEAVGRAAAPVAGQALENYMVRTGGVLPLDTWHGTPHRFPPTAKNPLGEFDPMKIGTGEGAQAYGVGAGYLAEAKDVAKGYQPRDIANEEGLLKLYSAAEKRGDYPAMEVLENAMLHKSPNELRGIHGNAGEKVIRQIEKIPRTVGSLYKVDLPDEQIAKMLDYDKPLSQQPKSVQAALSKYDADMYHPKGNDYDPNEMGSQIINRLAGTLAVRNPSPLSGSDQASQWLKDNGIPGIRYLDQGSRSGGAGTSNFVVFDPKHMNIIGRE